MRLRRSGYATGAAVCLGFAVAMAMAVGSGGSADAATGAAPSARERDVDRFLKGRAVLKRGKLSDLGEHNVAIAGRRSVKVKDIAKRAFADHHGFTDELKRGRSALLAEPVVEDEFVELDDVSILTTSTSMVVVDPEALRRSSPEFAKVRSGGMGSVPLASLDATAKADFAAYKTTVAALPAGHPLRTAAATSDQALLDAITAGVGDMGVTTTLVIPKTAIPFDTSGRPLPPVLAADGSFDYKKRRAARGVALVARPFLEEEVPPAPEVTASKTTKFKARFLAGFTEGDSWTWSRRWDVPTGYFRVSARAWYAYGLRIPIEIDTTMEPARFVAKGADEESEYAVTLSANTLDAPASFYESVGIDTALVHGGKELVLQAGFQATFRLKVMGINIDKSIPKDDAFDFSQDFKPPFGDCGTACGFDVWIPAELTHTKVSILGIVTGSVRAGFNVSGNGTVTVDYTGLYGADEIKSWERGAKTAAKKTHKLTFDRKAKTHKRVAALAPLPRVGASKAFGFAVSEPRYSWDVRITPGVRADVHVNAKPIFKDSFTIGPMWLNDLAFDLGTLKLDKHRGTKSRYKVKNGEKSWKK